MSGYNEGKSEGINMGCNGMDSNMDLVCKICAKAFKFQSGLSRHGRTHKQLALKCDCGLVFSRQDNLKRHQFMSPTCRTLEKAEEFHAFKSDDSSKTADRGLPKSNVENSSYISMNAFTQTEKHEDIKSDSDDNSDSSETDEDCKTATNPKLISVHKSSEDDESDSSVPDIKNHQSSVDNNSNSSIPVIKNRKKKRRMHRLKIHKFIKSEKQSLPTPPNSYRTDLSNQYGIDSFSTYGRNIIRKLSTTQNLARFKPRQHNPSVNGVGLLGQLSGT